MASKDEKIALGLQEDATQEQVLTRIADLTAASQLLEGTGGASEDRVRLILAATSTTPDGYYRRGTFMIPTDANTPLVLDLDELENTKEVVIDGKPVVRFVDGKPVAVTGKDLLAELMADPSIVKIRSDAPATPLGAVKRFLPA
jgi:hypothetical protein